MVVTPPRLTTKALAVLPTSTGLPPPPQQLPGLELLKVSPRAALCGKMEDTQFLWDMQTCLSVSDSTALYSQVMGERAGFVGEDIGVAGGARFVGFP